MRHKTRVVKEGRAQRRSPSRSARTRYWANSARATRASDRALRVWRGSIPDRSDATCPTTFTCANRLLLGKFIKRERDLSSDLVHSVGHVQHSTDCGTRLEISRQRRKQLQRQGRFEIAAGNPPGSSRGTRVARLENAMVRHLWIVAVVIPAPALHIPHRSAFHGSPCGGSHLRLHVGENLRENEESRGTSLPHHRRPPSGVR